MISYEQFQVSWLTHIVGGLLRRYPQFPIQLGRLESRALGDLLSEQKIHTPIYVTGLARGGTTILLEFLAQHADVATHRYQDYLGIFTPYWWEESTKGQADVPAQERAHGDGLKVTPQSPEALEECLWMAFFDQIHRTDASNVLDETTSHVKFERFYRDHIAKLLLARNRSRYVAKGNYNVARMRYLLKLFPDAKFVIAVRSPRDHVASLLKQHRLFCAAEQEYPRALAYMQRVGHFEFGLDRRPIHLGDDKSTQSIIRSWNSGDEVRGLARYWAEIYGWLHNQVSQSDTLRDAVLMVRYETLCESPRETLTGILDHCRLPSEELANQFAPTIAAPTYYEPSFSVEEEQIIQDETAEVASHYGYQGEMAPASPQASPVA